MANYGFGKTPTQDLKVELPTRPKKEQTSVSKADIARLAKAAEQTGYVDRSPTKRRKPGPKQREEQDRIMMTGPKRVLQEFRQLCDDKEQSYWEGLEDLMVAFKQDRT